MNTRQRPNRPKESSKQSTNIGTSQFDVDELSEKELEQLLFQEETDKEQGIWNLPTIAGLTLVTGGMGYLLFEMGLLTGVEMGQLSAMMPWLAGILIILIGLGVLSWRPNKRKNKMKERLREVREEKVKPEKAKVAAKKKKKSRKLTKSRADRKIFGVCGGIAEHMNLDPTLVRIAFIVATIFSSGPFILAYLALAYVMPNPEELEEHITIVRDPE